MLSKHYGLYYKNGAWFVRNYGREIKTGVPMIGLRARVISWARNRRGEGKIIDLKRIVPRPGPPEDYERDQRADQQVAKICDQMAGEAACAPRGDEQGQG